METIKEWLNGAKDYASGLALLAKYSKNKILLQALARKTLPEKLEYELRKLSEESIPFSVTPINHVQQLPDNDPVKVGGSPRIDPSALPDHLKQLWGETAEKYRLARSLHEKLKLMTDADQRLPLLAQLEKYRKEIRTNWDVIDTWASEQGNRQTLEIDTKRINADRKYISDGKKVVDSLHGASRAKKLEGMQRRINELLSVGEKFDPENQRELELLGMKFDG